MKKSLYIALLITACVINTSKVKAISLQTRIRDLRQGVNSLLTGPSELSKGLNKVGTCASEFFQRPKVLTIVKVACPIIIVWEGSKKMLKNKSSFMNRLIGLGLTVSGLGILAYQTDLIRHIQGYRPIQF